MSGRSITLPHYSWAGLDLLIGYQYYVTILSPVLELVEGAKWPKIINFHENMAGPEIETDNSDYTAWLRRISKLCSRISSVRDKNRQTKCLQMDKGRGGFLALEIIAHS